MDRADFAEPKSELEGSVVVLAGHTEAGEGRTVLLGVVRCLPRSV